MARLLVTRRAIRRHRGLIQHMAARHHAGLAQLGDPEGWALWALALVYCAERATNHFSDGVVAQLEALPDSVKTLAASYVTLGLRQN